MFNLMHPDISYLIVAPNSSDQADEMSTYLYSKNYEVYKTETYNSHFESSYVAQNSTITNPGIHGDSIFLLKKFDLPYITEKLKNEKNPKRIFQDGKTIKLSLTSSYADNQPLYVYEGFSFAFSEDKEYFYPKKKEDLKRGMIVEYCNNDIWKEKIILNLDTEYDDMYKLLIKYDKLRVSEGNSSN